MQKERNGSGKSSYHKRFCDNTKIVCKYLNILETQICCCELILTFKKKASNDRSNNKSFKLQHKIIQTF